jgi:hypothetical protein
MSISTTPPGQEQNLQLFAIAEYSFGSTTSFFPSLEIVSDNLPLVSLLAAIICVAGTYCIAVKKKTLCYAGLVSRQEVTGTVKNYCPCLVNNCYDYCYGWLEIYRSHHHRKRLFPNQWNISLSNNYGSLKHMVGNGIFSKPS